MIDTMVMIAYNEAIEMEVMEEVERCGLKNYTKITGAFGRGAASGTHLGNDIWPGRNNVLYAACVQKEAKELMVRIKELRKKLGREGVKAFMWKIDEIT